MDENGNGTDDVTVQLSFMPTSFRPDNLDRLIGEIITTVVPRHAKNTLQTEAQQEHYCQGSNKLPDYDATKNQRTA